MRPTNRLASAALPTDDNGEYSLLRHAQVAYRAGNKCREIRNVFTIPVKNTTGGALSLTAAELLTIIGVELASFSMGFGRRVYEEVDTKLTIADLRRFSFELVGRDAVEIVDDAGATFELVDYDASADTIAIGAGATKSVVIYVYRAFWVEQLEKEADGLCPGWSQMRQIGIDCKRGLTANYPANFTRDATAAGSVVFRTSDAPSRHDRWVSPVRLHKHSNAAQIVPVLPRPGAVLALFETSTAHDSTTLTNVSLTLDGAKLYDSELAKDLGKWRKRNQPLGALDTGTLCVVLYGCDPHEQLSELPVGESLVFEQQTHVLQTPQLTIVYIPAEEATWWEGFVLLNLLSVQGQTGPIKLTREGASAVTGRAAALLPATILRPDDAGYETTAGLTGIDVGGSVRATEHIPRFMADAVAAVSVSAPNLEGQQAAAAEAVQAVARNIPGFSSAVGGRVTGRAEGLVKFLVPKAVGRVDAGMRAATRKS